MAGTVAPISDLSTALGGSGDPSYPSVDRLYDNVQAEVPAVALAAVKLAAWNAIEDFYIQSTARREMIYWQMPVGVYAVNFDPFDANWNVCWVLGYTGLTKGKVEPPGLLRDVQWPQSTLLRTGQALVALKPASFSVDCGPLLWVQWFEAILAGTLHRLYRQPAKPYSSPQLAQFYGVQYRAGVARARDIARRDYTNGPGLWQVPYFAMGRRKS